MTTAKTKGSGFLKVTGILMIIGGGISIILGIIAALGVAALAYISDGEISSAMLYASVALMIVSAVAQLIAGIIGVKNCKKPEKAGTCMVWGIIVAVLCVVDEAKKGMTFRNYKDLLFVGGGGHRTGKDGGNWTELENFFRKYFPEAQVKYRWAAQDCMSLDGVPYIGQYSPSLPNIYVVSGFNKWGITSSMAAAMIVTDAVLERKNKYSNVFAPDRSVMRPQLLANAAESVMGLLTPRTKRCPHMGCALKWNSAEHSWDCPCHGSRFSEEGQLIDNPATGDLKSFKSTP